MSCEARVALFGAGAGKVELVTGASPYLAESEDSLEPLASQSLPPVTPFSVAFSVAAEVEWLPLLLLLLLEFEAVVVEVGS